jgi:hypothetical protein
LVTVVDVVGVWAVAAAREEDLVQPLVWAVGMEESFGAVPFTLHGAEDMPRLTGLTP